MKRIVLLIDGTWNRRDALLPTNVKKTADLIARSAQDGAKQQIIYLDGVGAGMVSSRLGRAIDICLGGALGWGLGYVISDAYHHLCQNFEPGDEVFVFGFSRGAWAARSLIGLIRKCGILAPSQSHRIADVVGLYWNKRSPTDSVEAFEMRRTWSPQIVTSESEAQYREQTGFLGHRLFAVRFLGLWDTVGALGVPRHPLVPKTWFDNKASLHDLQVSSIVGSLRHAAAIDERRSYFPFTPIVAPSHLRTADDEPSDRFLELWFPGDHGSVGGGGKIVGLSSIALRWVLEGAIDQGLGVDLPALDRIKELEDFGAPLSNRRTRSGFAGRLQEMVSSDRRGPASIGQVSNAARLRWRDSGYRPSALLHLAKYLDEAT